MKYPLIAQINLPKFQVPQDFGYPGFGKYSTGIDIKCSENTQVQAIEDGIILNVKDYSGLYSNNPWWNPTKSVFVEGASGVIVYSCISPQQSIFIGGFVNEGDILGIVKSLSKDNVHLNLQNYSFGEKDFINWKFKSEQPENIHNPRNLILKTI